MTDHVCLTVRIVMPLLIGVMNGTVALYYQLGFATVKIGDILSELMLPSKLES